MSCTDFRQCTSTSPLELSQTFYYIRIMNRKSEMVKPSNYFKEALSKFWGLVSFQMLELPSNSFY